MKPLQKKQLEGCLCRVPHSFYNKVWDVITRTPQGINILGFVIPQQPTISNMTRSEITFALLVEEVCKRNNHLKLFKWTNFYLLDAQSYSAT